MKPDLQQDSFSVWASDHMVYGPVDLATLAQWVQEGRVFPKTWLHAQEHGSWFQAEALEALGGFFRRSAAVPVGKPAPPADTETLVEELRQFPVFTGLTNAQLEQFLQFGELVQAPPGHLILKRRDPSDSLFFLLAGEVRARLLVGYEDKSLGRMAAGECFGEVAMFTQSPRSADVIAETDTRMLRLTSEACLLLVNQLPQIAAPIFFGIAKMMAARIAERNLQYQRDAASEFLWH